MLKGGTQVQKIIVLSILTALLMTGCDIDDGGAVESAGEYVRGLGESVDLEAIENELDTLVQEIGERVDLESLENELDSILVDIEEEIKKL